MLVLHCDAGGWVNESFAVCYLVWCRLVKKEELKRRFSGMALGQGM